MGWGECAQSGWNRNRVELKGCNGRKEKMVEEVGSHKSSDGQEAVVFHCIEAEEWTGC